MTLLTNFLRPIMPITHFNVMVMSEPWLRHKGVRPRLTGEFITQNTTGWYENVEVKLQGPVVFVVGSAT
jgi:hypothetical protein